MENQKIKFAVVGCGHIGTRHAQMIRENDECELIALCDIKPKKDLAIRDFDIPFFNQLEALLRTVSAVDVVCICTPNASHAPLSLQVLRAGKHVVCEKPMGLTKTECESVLSLALNQSKQVFCVMQNRYSPPAVWLKSIVDQGLMGELYMVKVDCFWNRDDRYYLPGNQPHEWHGDIKLDGGTLFTQFSHFIDMLYWLFGDFKNIDARFFDFCHQHSTGFEDSGIINFEFAKGGIGTINYSTAVWDKNFESTITIIGKKGTVKVGGQYMNRIDYCHVENYERPVLQEAPPPNDYGTYKGSAANHHFVIQNVVDVLKGRKKVATNALEGLKVVEIIERIYARKNSKN